METKTYILGLVIIFILRIVTEALLDDMIIGVLWFAYCIFKRLQSGEWEWDIYD